MNTKMSIVAITSIIAILGIMIVPNTAVAETNQNNISVKPINEKFSLETTITTLSVPENNALPWGTVYGSERVVIVVSKLNFSFIGLTLMLF